MLNLQQLIIFALEILYYSLFFHLARRKDKFLKVLCMFILINIVLLIIGFNSFHAYTMILIGMAILTRIFNMKVSLYDVLVMIVSLIFKLCIELLFFIVLQNNISLFIWVLVMGISKNLILIFLKDKLHILYNKFKKLWDRNNFYIRYSFSTLLYLYIIASIVYIICRI